MKTSWKIWWDCLCNRPADDDWIEFLIDCSDHWVILITIFFVIPMTSFVVLVWRCERHLERVDIDDPRTW